MYAAQLVSFGNPVESLEYAEIADPGKPSSTEVLVQVEYCPINPNDLMVAEGTYGVLPSLPSVIGNEGVGTILSIGSNVHNVQVGDRVLLPLSGHTWRERMIIPAADLFALPKNADLQQLSMLGINPATAFLIITEFVDLKPGDWILQNAANSGVGRWVIAFAKARGLKTINIVRRTELISELESIGADAVIVQSADISQKIKEATNSADIRLGFDGISGPATGIIAANLSLYGTLVIYAAMSETAISINPLDPIFKSLTIKGFWMGHRQYASKIPAAIKQAADMIATKQVKIPIAGVYPLSQIKKAVEHATSGGKVLLSIGNSVEKN
jgi:NADPH:quinone reductase-like Zn-dependent oxidoreductase